MKNKKNKKKTIICTAAAALLLIVSGVLMYINSPRYIIKNTVMWYEKDFTLPLFCQKIKFKYNKETGNYTGKFQISERGKDRLLENLDAAQSRFAASQNAIFSYTRKRLEDMEEEVLNASSVINLLVETKGNKVVKREDIEPEKIYPEEWMVEEDAELLGYYCTHPRYIEGVTLFQDALRGREPYCYIVIYKNKDDKYYLCIKRTDFSDWNGHYGGR